MGRSFQLLLEINLPSLQTCSASINVCLPSWSTDVFDATRSSIIKDLDNFFQRFLTRLREQEEDVDEHGKTEDSEDDVDLPSNVGEGRGHEIG